MLYRFSYFLPFASRVLSFLSRTTETTFTIPGYRVIIICFFEACYNTLANLLEAPAYLWLIMGVAFTVDIILSMALSAAMHAYVNGKISYMWPSYICIIQFASYIAFQVFDYSSQTSIIICFAIKMIVDIAAIAYIFKVIVGEMKYADD